MRKRPQRLLILAALAGVILCVVLLRLDQVDNDLPGVEDPVRERYAQRVQRPAAPPAAPVSRPAPPSLETPSTPPSVPTTDPLTEFISEIKTELQDCYLDALERDPSLETTLVLTVQFAENEDGIAVVDELIADPNRQVEDDQLVECAMDAFEPLEVDQPGLDGVVLSWPLVFQPTEPSP